jgi:hypothetical protein
VQDHSDFGITGSDHVQGVEVFVRLSESRWFQVFHHIVLRKCVHENRCSNSEIREMTVRNKSASGHMLS